jgi:malic enzyme
MFDRDQDGNEIIRIAARGRDVLNESLANRGSAFTHSERDALGITGLLPSVVSTIEQQVARVYSSICRKPDRLEQYIGLEALAGRNEVLFYRALLDHIEEFLPVVYTPTVGEACQKYSHIFRRSRGVWITPDHRGRIRDVLDNHRTVEGIRLICVTDNERILGLGDQGAGGIGIPVGKLSLYVVGAGFHPMSILPVSLDVGTDNEELLADPFYVGYRHRRLRGEAYASLVEEFVEAVTATFPRALLQWEDFKKKTAFDNLDKYVDRLLSFNDDIQGTAAVALAGIVAATRISKIPLREQRVVIAGAGAAGIGIGRLIRAELARAGIEGDDLTSRVGLLDSGGFLTDAREFRDVYKRELAWPAALAEKHGLPRDGAADLAAVVDTLKPTVLIGTTGRPGTFGEAALRGMAKHTPRPVVFPYSNPTANAEATPEEILAWTGGTAIVASGSPFAPVEYEGRTIHIGQGNNVYIFPGVGLGAVVAGATKVTDEMFAVAAETLAHLVADSDIEKGAVYPSLEKLREISRAIAIAVGEEAMNAGVAPRVSREALERAVTNAMWEPKYARLVVE